MTTPKASKTESPAANPTDWLAASFDFAQSWIEVSTRQLEALYDFEPAPDPLNVRDAMGELAQSIALNPEALTRVQASLLADYVTLSTRLLGLADDGGEAVATPAADDRRFRDEAWEENPVFDTVKQAYLATGRAMLEVIDGAHSLDDGTRIRLDFFTRQVIDALSPSNFFATNPQVLRKTFESGGANLLAGFHNLAEDFRDNGGRFNVSMVDQDAFEVGRNLAVTPGKIVFQNHLLQVIQYAPTTEEVKKRPLLIVPPWMNKYYILDLRPGNSMVQWLIDQGHTVFMVSWVNPDASMSGTTFDDYLLDGLGAAVGAVVEHTGEPDVNVIGYCLGGILVAAGLAYMQSKGDERIASATLLTTMVDFSDAGELQLFINEHSLPDLEARIRAKGCLDGATMYEATRVIRANDLVWSFYVNNYLLGNPPPAFDLLYWNNDGTNMPAAVHTYFMRNMYLENKLRQPGALQVAGVDIDVGTITTPTYVLATAEDHIAPWKTCFETVDLFAGPVEFVLGESGHIAGVINPPSKDKYGYYANADAKGADAEAWLTDARRIQGSWWPNWERWVDGFSAGRVPARKAGEGKLEALEDAPGSYVLGALGDAA